MITLALEFLTTKAGKMVAGVIAGLICVGLFAWDQQSRGANKAVAKIERKDAANVKKADTVGAKSRDPTSRGMLDPAVRND